MTDSRPRISADALKILGAMLEDPLAWHYGLGLSKSAKVASGTVYPMLARLENSGWLESKWENPAKEEENRPRRRLYRLTGLGERQAMNQLEEIVEVGKRVRRRRARMGRSQKRLA